MLSFCGERRTGCKCTLQFRKTLPLGKLGEDDMGFSELVLTTAGEPITTSIKSLIFTKEISQGSRDVSLLSCVGTVAES